jgi:methionyl-tRNA synthetase
MSKRLLVTAGLPYSNGRPHVGHIAGCYLPGDIYVRFERMRGRDVRYVCGSDDHGVAIMIAAEKEGKTPAELSAFYNQKQQAAFKGLGIEFDVFGSTSQTPQHAPMSQSFFKAIHDKGYFEKITSQQFYDESKDMFLADRYVQGTCTYCNTPDQHGDQCENCGKLLDVDHLKDARSVLSGAPASVKDTVHWFFDLSRFEKEVSDWVDQADMREGTRSYVKSLVKSGLVKRSITRDISWGIPVPLEDPDAEGKVLYVWFDAPIGYISNTMQMLQDAGGNETDFEKWWKSEESDVVHFIGEDNTIFHCVIWIAMLTAEGTYRLPKGVVVNQFLNIQFPDKEVEKISKSRGSAVWIEDYLEEGGSPDVLRYYLTSIAPEKARTVYAPDDLIQKNNADLANTLGNFVNRILTFTRKRVGETVPEYPEEKVTDLDREFYARREAVHKEVGELLETYQMKAALARVMEFARECNKYIDEKQPWVTRKTDMETTCVTLSHCIYAMQALSVWLAPFLPEASARLARMLGRETPGAWETALDHPRQGDALGEPEILFQKIEAETTDA